MTVNFPSSASNNQIYSFGTRTWQWVNTNGGFWKSVVGNTISTFAQTYILTANSFGSSSEIELLQLGGNRIPVPANSTMYYTVDLVGRGFDAATQIVPYHAAYQIKGVADNQNGSVNDLGNLYEVTLYRDIPTLIVDTRVSTVFKTLGVYVITGNQYNMNWVASVSTVQVSY